MEGPALSRGSTVSVPSALEGDGPVGPGPQTPHSSMEGPTASDKPVVCPFRPK